MAQPVTIKGGKVIVKLSDTNSPGVFTAPCGFTQRSITLNKGLEEVKIPDCDDPDQVDWLGRDASSLSMTVSGEGVMAQSSAEVWLDAFDSVDSWPVEVDVVFPSKTIRWYGSMHLESVEIGAPNGQRVTCNVSLQSDGPMVRTVTP
jgi:hypothetical protein